MTSSERQKKFRDSHAKIMIPNELKAVLDGKAKPLGITPVELLHRLLTQDQKPLRLTPAINQDQEPLRLTPEDKVMHLVRDGHHGKTREVISLYCSNTAAYAAISGFKAFEHPYRNIRLCKTDIGRTLARLQNCVSATKAKQQDYLEK